MPFMSLFRSVVIFSTRFINNNSIDISGFNAHGLLNITLVSHAEKSTPASGRYGVPSLPDYHDFYLAEDIKNEILDLLHEQEICWIPGSRAGGCSIFIRHNGLPAMYWQGLP